VNLDSSRTLGGLVFGGTTPGANWFVTNSTLTLQTSSGNPTITANDGSNVVGSVVGGNQGFIKAGNGAIILSASNNPVLSSNIIVNAGLLVVSNNSALGVTMPNGSTIISNAVVITNNGSLVIPGAIQPNLHSAFVRGAGLGGTQGVIYADLSTRAQGDSSTRWSIGLLTAQSPAVVMLGDTTIRVDGTNNTVLAAGMLIGHITTSNALTGTSANNTNFTLTKTGTGQLRVDPANGYTGGNIHIAQGSMAFGNNGDLPGFQTITIDTGTYLYCRNITSLNSLNSTLIVNGLVDLDGRGNGNPGSDTTTATQRIGYLAGSGIVTNGSAGNIGANTLTIGGTNGATSTFSGVIPRCGNGSISLSFSCTNSTERFTGNNSYTGTTVLNAGTLLVNGTTTGGGAYTVNASGTLGGTGALSAAAINISSGTIMAGDPASPGGTFTINTNITTASPGAVVISNATLFANGSVGASGQPIGTMYLTNGMLEFPLNTLGASIFVTALNIDGNANIQFQIATPIKGVFPVISYSSIGGLAGFGGLSLITPPGVGATLSNDTVNSTIDVVITSVPVITWTGVPNGNWDIGTTTNWTEGSGGEAYTEPGGMGLIVNFDDTAPGTTSVNLTTTVTPKGVLVNSSSLNYAFSGVGNVTGTGAMTKQGSSAFTVANSGNNFTGGVNLLQGTLQLGNGGTSGDLGSGPIANSGTFVLNRSDSFTLPNTVSGNGNLTQSGAGSVTVPVSGNSSGAVTINSGTLQLGPSGSNQFSGSVTGSGAFGVNGGGAIVLTGGTASYSGGTVISNGTLQFSSVFPPAGNITDNGTLALGVGGTLANNVSGSGGVSLVSGASVTLGGVMSYTGPTRVLNSILNSTGVEYPSGSVLVLGNQNGAETGTANFTAGNPVLGGLQVGGNLNALAANQINLSGGGQTLTINGNVSFGNNTMAAAPVSFAATGTGVTIAIATNGGTIQSGLYTSPNSGNPDSLYVDFSQIDNFIANLGTNGAFNLGTLDGNPGPTTSVNEFFLAGVSNAITAGSVTLGAGGRQLVPKLLLGPGTNILNVNSLNVGTGGRDGGYLLFAGGSGGLRVRAVDGISPAMMNVGSNSTATGAAVTNIVDLTGHPIDLLLNTLIIGDYPNRVGTNNSDTFSMDQGSVSALTTSIAGGALATHFSDVATLNVNGGTASLGAVTLTASAAAGTLSINNATVTVASIVSPGAGTAELDVNNSTFNVALTTSGNPVTAPVAVKTFNPNTVNLGLSGSAFTVGQFPLINYTGSISGGGFAALNLVSLPAGVSGYLSNNVANLSVDMVITNAPAVINPNPTNITVLVSGNQLTLSWPADHTGWLLQSNSVGLTSSNSWFTLPGSGSTNKFIFTVDATKPTVFFRMLKP
jgi:autotransporter-associated beta strand protein